MTGEIAKKFDQKGFGFIKAGKSEIFFHVSDCVTRFEELIEGDQVSFDSANSPKGPRAVDVKRIE